MGQLYSVICKLCLNKAVFKKCIFSAYWWYWTHFHLHVVYLYVFFEKTCFVSLSLFKWVAVFLLLIRTCSLYINILDIRASQVALVIKNPLANAGDIRDVGSIPGLGRSPWRRVWQLCLPGESHGQRSLAGYSPQSCTEPDMTEAI